MKDVSDIPFWGRQKPLRNYFNNGVVKFSVKDSELHFEIKFITKKGQGPLLFGKVEDKEHLETFLLLKSIEDIHVRN